MTRRSLLVALFVRQTPVGFSVSGPLTATEQERQEGYASIGNDFALSVHPRSGIVYQRFLGLVGTDVTVHVEPA